MAGGSQDKFFLDGFVGTIKVDYKKNMFYGHILNVKENHFYEGSTIEELFDKFVSVVQLLTTQKVYKNDK